MKTQRCKYGVLAKATITFLCVGLMWPCFSRSYKFRLKGGTADSKNSGYFYDKVVKKDSFLVEMGAPSKIDSLDEIEIRAATLLKDIKSKKSVVNDVATLKFTPTGRKQVFVVECGAAAGTRDRSYYGADYSHGYIKGGVIIEFWQNGKCIKHWSSATGPLSKTKLTSDTKCAHIGADGYERSDVSYRPFENATTITEQKDDDSEDTEKPGEGQGDGKDYYVIRDSRYISDDDREYVFFKLGKETSQNGASYMRSRIFKRKFTQKELDEYKTIYANCKFFATLDEMKDFVKNEADRTEEDRKPLAYAIRNAENITTYDRRVVFEDLGSGYSSYSSGNIVVRRFSDQDIEDFKMINPKSQVFRTLDELKAFMRTAKVVDVETPRRAIRRSAQEPSSQDATRPATSADCQLSMEELDARIKAEMEHEKEMIQRKLNEQD